MFLRSSDDTHLNDDLFSFAPDTADPTDPEVDTFPDIETTLFADG